MRAFLGGLVLATVLVAAGVAGAGGWATAGLAPPPGNLKAGDTWKAELTILQHGRTPLAGVQPTVTIRKAKSGETKTFGAKPTGKPGVYRADVKFPSGGTWTYAVYDGFTQYGGAKTHTFAPVTIGAGTADGGGIPALPLTIVAALLAAAALVLVAKRIRPRTAPAAQ